MKTRVLRNADLRGAEAIAWRDETILAVGTEDDVLHAAGHDASIFDAKGRTVLPGFIDPHHHAAILALYGAARRLVAPEVTNIASLQKAIASEAARSKDEWVVLIDWNEELLAERRAPTRTELDEALPDRPLIAMHYTCHRAVVNSRALEAAGIDRHTPDPAGGLIERGSGGIPTGLLMERAMSIVEGKARRSLVATDPERFIQRLGVHYRALAEAGITYLVDALVPEDLAQLFEEADRRGLLIVPTTIMPASTVGGYLDAPWSALDGKPSGEKRGNLGVGPVKLVFDGSPVCAMCLSWWQSAAATIGALALTIRQGSLAAIRTSLSARPTFGRQIRSGILMYDPTSANAIMAEASARGFAVATHAIGNAAVDLALDAYASLGSALHDHGTARIEHACFLGREHIARIADLGVAVVMQPNFITFPAIAHAPKIPGLRYQPVRSLVAAGVIVSGSSDHPVQTFDPLVGIRAAMRRVTSTGDLHEPDERIGLDEAIALYTRDAARAASLADRGTLEVGKRADFVILDGALPDDARVCTTVIGGEAVFGEI